MITEAESIAKIHALADSIYSCGSMEKIINALIDAYEMGKEVGQAEADPR